MATNSATLFTFLPTDAQYLGAYLTAIAPLFKRGATVGLQFSHELSGGMNTYFAGNLPRGSQGYTATTGVKVIIAWKPANNALAGAVKWGVAFNLAGQTDRPNPEIDNFPLPGSANEIAGTSSVSSTVVGGIVYTTISVPAASIQNGQTTAPAGGDLYELRIRRFGNSDAADTLTAPAILLNVEVQDY